MGGSMWATSPGKKQGSTFHFSIRCPVKADAESDSSAASSSSSLENELSIGAEQVAQPRPDAGSPVGKNFLAAARLFTTCSTGGQSAVVVLQCLPPTSHKTPFLPGIEAFVESSCRE